MIHFITDGRTGVLLCLWFGSHLDVQTKGAIEVEEKGNRLLVRSRPWAQELATGLLRPHKCQGGLACVAHGQLARSRQDQNSMFDTSTSASAPQRQVRMTLGVRFGNFQYSTLVPSIKASNKSI